MSTNRFVPIRAIVLKNGELVPFWKCRYSHDDYYGDNYFYEDEKYHSTVEVAWDCKEQKIAQCFFIDVKNDESPTFRIGEVVGYEEKVHDIIIDTILDFEWEYNETYFEKIKNVSDERIKQYQIPNDARIVGFRYYRKKYKFASSNRLVHEIYIRKITDTRDKE